MRGEGGNVGMVCLGMKKIALCTKGLGFTGMDNAGYVYFVFQGWYMKESISFPVY